MTDSITKFLFRRRTAFLPFAALGMIIWGHPRVCGFLVGLGLIVLGESIRVWASGHLAKMKELTVSGPFGWVRNPLYIGSFLIACGYSAMTGGWVVWAIVMPMFIAAHASAVRWEEKRLLGLYGEDYISYCRTVPRWIPRRPASGGGMVGRFSPERVRVNRESKTIIGTALVVIAFAARLLADG